MEWLFKLVCVKSDQIASADYETVQTCKDFEVCMIIYK